MSILASQPPQRCGSRETSRQEIRGARTRSPDPSKAAGLRVGHPRRRSGSHEIWAQGRAPPRSNRRRSPAPRVASSLGVSPLVSGVETHRCSDSDGWPGSRRDAGPMCSSNDDRRRNFFRVDSFIRESYGRSACGSRLAPEFEPSRRWKIAGARRSPPPSSHQLLRGCRSESGRERPGMSAVFQHRATSAPHASVGGHGCGGLSSNNRVWTNTSPSRMKLRRLLHAFHGRILGMNGPKQAAIIVQQKRPPGVAFRQHPRHCHLAPARATLPRSDQRVFVSHETSPASIVYSKPRRKPHRAAACATCLRQIGAQDRR